MNKINTTNLLKGVGLALLFYTVYTLSKLYTFDNDPYLKRAVYVHKTMIKLTIGEYLRNVFIIFVPIIIILFCLRYKSKN